MLKGFGAPITSLCDLILGSRRSCEVGRSAERLEASKPFAAQERARIHGSAMTRPIRRAGAATCALPEPLRSCRTPIHG
jgi:hypothetical protein